MRRLKHGSNCIERMVLVAGFAALCVFGTSKAATLSTWEPHEIVLTPEREHPWWEFPVRAVFRLEASQRVLTVEGYWDGAGRWVIRTALPQPGTWIWRTESQDPGLADKTGQLEVRASSEEQLRENANRRGHIRPAPGGRYFQYADGTPCFVLADTLWAGNTARCGLAANGTGPFTEFLADRKDKGFTAVLVQLVHGYGDYPDGQAHRNEGGYAFADRDPTRLNAAFFRGLDRRMLVLWERGFVTAAPIMWWGKTRQAVFSAEDARRLSAYCAVRYGAFNSLWCVSGEYQYTFADCRWSASDLSALGVEMQKHNPWKHPISIHPSGQTGWKPPHNVQSSRPFHGEPWIDHHWLQTGQSIDRMHNIVTRTAEDRDLRPVQPVFCSESFYEVATDPHSAYHARWQAWTAFLSGAAGYGYGVQGLWQFLDRNDAQGETGKLSDSRPVPWQEALRLPGSAQVGHVRTLLEPLPWWRLEPCRDKLLIGGKSNPLPTGTNLSPPQAAIIDGKTLVIYVPRGNNAREIKMAAGLKEVTGAHWFDPRTGKFVGHRMSMSSTVPERPEPKNEDWVLLAE